MKVWCGFLAVGLCAAMLAGCGKSSTSIKVDGSSTVYPITEAVAEEFRKEQPNVRVTVGIAGTGGGMKKFSAGELDICDASRPIKDAEKQACEASGVEFTVFEIAFDGLALTVNKENDWCSCLTTAQLKAIWQPESAVMKWSDVNPDWPDKPMQLYGPGTDSGTFDYFTEAICGKQDASRNDYTQSEDDNVLVTGVEGDKFSLGYFGYAYFNENKERLKLLAVDSGDGHCVLPSPETVRDHSYKPLSRPLFLYVRNSSLARPEVAQFVEFYLKHAGQLVPQVGYMTVPDEVGAKNDATYAAALAAVPKDTGAKKP